MAEGVAWGINKKPPPLSGVAGSVRVATPYRHQALPLSIKPQYIRGSTSFLSMYILQRSLL